MEEDFKSFTKLSWLKKESSLHSSDLEILPARYTVQYVMEEMFIYFEKRLNQIADDEPLDKLLNKSFKRGEDSYLNSLLRTLFGICETCLPSVLTVLIKWYEHQQRVSISQVGEVRDRAIKKTLVASYIFCIVSIEILLQVHFHPTECQSQINFIVGTSFNQISYKDQSVFGINYNNSLIVSEIFAEVIGVLSQTHCKLIQKYFIDNLNELRKEIPINTHSVICLLMGMKYFRIKTNEVSSIEEGVAFLEEIGSYYLEVDLKQKDLKHALAGLLVEILIPMAAQIKTEANVPALISFVDKLYNPTYDLINKKQHKLAAYPLLTCLLCISQNKFFLSTWVQFLNLTLANLKNKDSRISRMALESLYRLIWVYTIRISCEGNSVTRSRLEGICASLFPRGSRNVVPRDAPLNIFVKIIHFISQYRIDFAFREIIYDLLGCSRASSRTLSIYPERMNIGIRALMVIFDGIQQNESPPGMPRSIGFVPFGTIQRQKRSYLTQPLSFETAISLGLEQYYPACRKAFDSILRTLDSQIGRSFMLTAAHIRGKEYNEVINCEMRAKLDLFRTCIAAIPRFLPDPMSHQDLIEFVIRMCVHVDEEIRLTAYQSLQNLVAECPDWREDIFHIFLRFLINQIQDTFPTLLESMVRLLLQLLSIWKLNVIEHLKGEATIMLKISTNKIGINSQSSISESCELINNSSSHSSSIERYINATAFVLHCIEGLALTLLCQLRPQIKRMAISLLYEVKGFLDFFPKQQKQQYETPVIEVLDEATPYVIEKYIQHVSDSEKKTWNKDFASFCEIVSNNISIDPILVNEDLGNEYFRWDIWASALSGFCEYSFLPSKCTVAISFAWPALLIRFNYCHQIIDPNNPQNENRSSLLRSSKSRFTNWPLCGDVLSHENYLSLWQKYIVMVFGLFQSKTTFLSNSALINNCSSRNFSPCFDSSEVNKSMISSVKMTRTGLLNCSQLLQKASIMIRWEATDIKDSVVLGMGSMNSECFELLFEEFNLKGILREVGERKNETNLRRKKRKDTLRLQLIRILELALFRGLFDHSTFFDRHSGSLSPLLLEFVESVRFHVESETIRDVKTMRIHFAKIVTEIVSSVPLDLRENLLPMDLRRSLFFLFFSWCSRILGNSSNDNRRKENNNDNNIGINVEQKAIQAMCSLFCVGSIFECQGQFGDEDYILRWIEALLSSNNTTINGICEELLCTMLHLNENFPQLFEKVLQMCYIKDELVGSRCFRSLALLFSQREYPCEFISLLCLCGTYASDSEDISIRQTAYLFISLLRRQFLDVNLSPLNISSIEEFNKNKKNVGENFDYKANYFSMSQTCISQQLAKQYSHLTMPIFSEICSRIESARPNRQIPMLIFLHEWIKNIVLIDNYCDIYLPKNSIEKEEENNNDCGWGSEEATQLILNNLLFLTAKLSCEHDKEIRELWKCLATNYLSNLPIIVHFLFMMISLSLENMLPLAKKISAYILEACGEQFITLLVNKLEKVGKSFKHLICRSEMPPFYRWEIEEEEEEENNNKNNFEEEKEFENNYENIEEGKCKNNKNQEFNNIYSKVPKQLTMPPYGGNYSRLSLLFLTQQQNNQNNTLSRSNMSLFLLCDLIGLKISICWNNYIPKLLHIAVINLDSFDKIICFHSRQIIINICLMFIEEKDVSLVQVATTLIKNQLRNQEKIKESKFDEIGQNNNNKSTNNNENNSSLTSSSILNSPKINLNNNNKLNNLINYFNYYKEQLFSVDALFCSKTELLKCILFCLSQNKYTNLWTWEDTTQRCWITESSKQVGRFVQRLVDFLLPKLPELAINWTQFAINFAFKIPNRHFFGRSFQIAGSLGTNPTPFIHLLISRLIDIFSENNDETQQSFIIELFICLQKMIQSIDNNSKTFSNGHCRSISYTRNFWEPLEANIKDEKKDIRHSLLLSSNFDIKKSPLKRSRSASMPKINTETCAYLTEENILSFAQLATISLLMLESNIDNEFLIGLHTFDKILQASGNQRSEFLSRLDEIVNKSCCESLNTEIIGLTLKGILYPFHGYECSISIFSKCLLSLNQKIVCKDAKESFSLIVAVSLPYCIQNFNSPTLQSSKLVQSISSHCRTELIQLSKEGEVCIDSFCDHPLSNLITMMDQYKEQTFPRDYTQWTKCVINYLLDAFKPDTFQLIIILTEMLEKSPISLHSCLLDILLLLFNYGNLNNCPPGFFNSQIVKTIFKHIHGSTSKEASNIFKAILEKWNVISVNKLSSNEKEFISKRKPEFEIRFEKPFLHEIVFSSDKLTLDCLASARQKIRKKLITLFSAFGLSPVCISTRHLSLLSKSFTDIQNEEKQKIIEEKNNLLFNEQQNNNNLIVDNRMSSPKSFVGGGVGGGGILLKENSNANSCCELISLRTTDSFPRVFKEFDFLEAENDSVSESAESCFNWLSTMRTPRICSENIDINTQNDQDELGDDEEEFYDEDVDLDSNNSNKNNSNSNLYSPKSFTTTNSNTRHSSLESIGILAVQQKNNLIKNKKRKRKGGWGRPTSFAASDSNNDISSDKTPIQSRHHSDDESSDEEEDQSECEQQNIEEEDESMSRGRRRIEEEMGREFGRRIEEIEGREGREDELMGREEKGKKEEQILREIGICTNNFIKNCDQQNDLEEQNNIVKMRRQIIIKNKNNNLILKNKQQPSSSIISSTTLSPSKTSTISSLKQQQHKIITRRNSSAESSHNSNSLYTTTINSAFIPLVYSDFKQQKQNSNKILEENNFIKLECSHHISGMVEHLWNNSISRLDDDQNGLIISNSIILLTQLFREKSIFLTRLLRDSLDICNNFIQKSDSTLQQRSGGSNSSMSDISLQLFRSLNFLLKFVECPFLFVSSQFLNSSDLLVIQKIALFELREHFDTFNEHQEQALRALNMLKSTQKLLLINEADNNKNNNNGGECSCSTSASLTSSFSSSVNQHFQFIKNQEFFLYKSLHKLCFQLLLVLEKFIEMCFSVQNSVNSQESDLTPAVTTLQKELLSHLSTSSSLDSFKTTSSSLNSEILLEKGENNNLLNIKQLLNQFKNVLMLYTTNKQFKNAFNKLAQLRNQYSSSGQFGCCEQIDIDVLLINFCTSHCSLSVWALIGSFEQLRLLCAQLKESNVQIGILLRNMPDK